MPVTNGPQFVRISTNMDMSSLTPVGPRLTWDELERQAVRREREARELAALRPEPLPAPVTTAAQIALESAKVPGTARTIGVHAIRLGWAVQAYYARGPIVHARSGLFLRMVDSVTLVFRHPGGELAQAWWQDGAAARATCWYRGEWPAPVAFTAGRKGKFTLKNWVEGERA